jgi:Lrp/AsnC family transcriptional regulator for asnA, asnC and gidA
MKVKKVSGAKKTEKTANDVKSVYNDDHKICDIEDRLTGVELKLLPIDSLDVKIICALRNDARQSNTNIARNLEVSEATVRRRIENLMESGILRGSSALVNFELIENCVKTFILIKVENTELERIVKNLAENRRIITIYRIAGEYDLICEGLFTSMGELQRFVDKDLLMDGIKKTDTQLVMGVYKRCPWLGI